MGGQRILEAVLDCTMHQGDKVFKVGLDLASSMYTPMCAQTLVAALHPEHGHMLRHQVQISGVHVAWLP